MNLIRQNSDPTFGLEHEFVQFVLALIELVQSFSKSFRIVLVMLHQHTKRNKVVSLFPFILAHFKHGHFYSEGVISAHAIDLE